MHRFQRWFFRVSLQGCLALAAAALCAGAAHAQLPATPSPAPSSSPLGALARPPALAAFVKGMTRSDGPIALYDKDGALYLDLSPENFKHAYMIAASIGASFGGFPLVGAGTHIDDDLVLRFKRVGSRVLAIEPNPHLLAATDPAAARDVAESFQDSVWSALPVVAEDTATGHVLVSGGFFLGDPAGVSRYLSLIGNYRADASRSYLDFVRGFPQNDSISVAETFSGNGGVTSVADPTSVMLKLHYSILQLPENDGYVPRLADERVGYFVATRRRFGITSSTGDPYVRYITRWNLKRGPVVFYLTDEIPATYRPTIRRAILKWNDAFAKIGYPHAVEVRDQPNDPNWDPEDFRYSTVRWALSDRPLYTAEGQWVADPFTGQILRASIVLDGEAIRAQAAADADLSRVDSDEALERQQCIAATVCGDYESRMAASSAYALAVLSTHGPLGTAQLDAYIKRQLFATVLHETGHAFGLRHNFAASTAYRLADLARPGFIAKHGLAASVMDYVPVYLPPGERRAEFQNVLGPYDAWAIRYGYQSFPNVTQPSDERARLAAIANRSGSPMLAYGTDEDAYGVNAIDPFIASMDLSSDPLAYDASLLATLRAAQVRLNRASVRADGSYGDERGAFDALMGEYARTAMLAVRYLGGVETSRTHRGEPGARPPFRALPRSQARRAFDLLDAAVFSAHALNFAPATLDNLGASHDWQWDSPNPLTYARDYSVVDQVGDVQDAVLYSTFSVNVMNRLIEASTRVSEPRATMSLEDLFSWSSASIWDTVLAARPGPDPLLHRSLQRKYTDLLISLALLGGPSKRLLLTPIGVMMFRLPPAQAQELARAELERLDAAIGRRADAGDAATRAHLRDERARIETALHAVMTHG
jgi:hypothetical protein